MKDIKLELEYMATEDLTPYENNAKIHTPEQIEQICASIRDFGMNDPIGIVGSDNLIVEGHGRLLACERLGIKEVPVIRLDHLSEEERKAYTLAHNKLTMNTGFDMDKLNAELQELVNMDMADYGFIELDEAPVDIKEDNFDVEDSAKEEPIAKRGDVYKLGNHRLMCGDSTSAEDVAKLMGDELADLVVTDPPYNVDLGTINKTKVKMAPERYNGANVDSIENDKMDDDAFVEFLTKAFKNADDHMRPGAAFYIWHSSTENYGFQTAMKNVGWKLRQIIMWNKSSLCLGLSDYQWKHEPCLYGWKDGAGHYFINDRTQTTVLDGRPIDYDALTREEAVKLLKKTYEELDNTTVLDFHKPLKNGEHPTMKPIELIAKQIYNSSKKNETVLDIFGGSGSTLMACDQLGRKCRMMEYDPHYVDVIIERWESLTGQRAEKVEE